MSSQHHNAPYETTDADAKQVSVWTISIFVTILAGLISMAALLFGFVKFPVSLDRTPTAAEYERNLPPTPRQYGYQAPTSTSNSAVTPSGSMLRR